MDERIARVRQAVSMRMRGASYERICRVCRFESATEARQAVSEYTERWFTGE